MEIGDVIRINNISDSFTVKNGEQYIIKLLTGCDQTYFPQNYINISGVKDCNSDGGYNIPIDSFELVVKEEKLEEIIDNSCIITLLKKLNIE